MRTQAYCLFNVSFDKQIDIWFLMKLQNARNWFVAKMVFPATIAIQLHLPARASPLPKKSRLSAAIFSLHLLCQLYQFIQEDLPLIQAKLSKKEHNRIGRGIAFIDADAFVLGFKVVIHKAKFFFRPALVDDIRWVTLLTLLF